MIEFDLLKQSEIIKFDDCCGIKSDKIKYISRIAARHRFTCLGGFWSAAPGAISFRQYSAQSQIPHFKIGLLLKTSPQDPPFPALLYCIRA